MKILNVVQNTDAWLEARKGKITGSRLGDVFSAKEAGKAEIQELLTNLEIPFKKGDSKDALLALVPEDQKINLPVKIARKTEFYQVLAERMGIVEDDEEDDRGRGHRCEEAAVQSFADATGKSITRIGFCISESNPDIALSPDGLIDNGGRFTEAVEIKCLLAKRHLQAWFEQEIPSDYKEQTLQYFIVNDDCETLYFCFYNEKVACKPFFYILVNRTDVAKEIESYLQYQKQIIAELNICANSLK